MNKKTKIITIVCFAIIFLISIILEGVSFSTNKFVFSTKYYKTSRKAFEKEDNTDYYVYFNIKQNYIGFFELAYEYYEKLL